jgi:hypothetical protein
MTTPRLLAAAGVALGLNAAGLLTVGARAPLAIPLVVVLLTIGELWLRALACHLADVPGRIGLGLVGGLISLPLIALALQTSGLLIRPLSLTAGLAVLTVLLGGVALLRERSGRPAVDPRFARTAATLTLAAAVAVIIGGGAAFAYVRMPHPPQPGYTSVALGGWAAGISAPVVIPPLGVQVPLRVSSTGKPTVVVPLTVHVGDNAYGPPRPATIAADTTSTLLVHVPAPPTGCLYRIAISLGPASTVFYGRGPSAC